MISLADFFPSTEEARFVYASFGYSCLIRESKRKDPFVPRSLQP
jgi:hypothetical protein